MDAWSLENLIRSYRYIAIFSTIFFVIKIVLYSFSSFDGGDISDDVDVSNASDVTFHYFSIQSVLAFLMGFGWIGLASLIQWKFSVINSLLIAAAAGAVFLYVSAYLMLKVKCLNQVIKVDYANCVGVVGKAYTTIHSKKEGQIQIEINGKLSVTNAINDTDSDISAFETIKVTKFENEKLYIEKI